MGALVIGAPVLEKEVNQMEEKKTRKAPKKDQKLNDLNDHIDRIQAFGPTHYRKADVIKLLKFFRDQYWR